MRLAFFGTGAFAVPALHALSRSVALVVTQPDRPAGRGLRLRPSPVRNAAHQLGIPVVSPERCREAEFLQTIEALQADALVVASYGQILPERLLSAARCGGINLHGSILPSFRGAAPIQRAILSGCTETGVTLMQMDKGMDTGDVIAIERTPIGPDEVFSELQVRLAGIAAEMAAKWLPLVIGGHADRFPQNHEQASYAPKVERIETELCFDRHAAQEYCRLRAFSDEPGAFVRTRHGNLKVRRARWSPMEGTPGEVVAASPELAVAFAGGSMLWLEVQPEGKKAMQGRDLANGWRLKAGMSLLPETETTSTPL